MHSPKQAQTTTCYSNHKQLEFINWSTDWPHGSDWLSARSLHRCYLTQWKTASGKHRSPPISQSVVDEYNA
eukprot:6269633-Alexandrium_andersonii.AAC.1